MSLIPSNVLGASGQPQGYLIQRSLRFRSSASAYLSRTPASAGNRRTFTLSVWVKRGRLGATQWLFDADNGSTDSTEFNFAFTSSDTLSVSGSLTTWRITTQVFRDPSAWYHILLSVDTTQATANNRIRLYVNGSEITAFSTTNNPTQNLDLGVNQAIAHYLGIRTGLTSPLDGYLAEVNFIDGQALTPSDFGYTNSYGVWQPTRYTGTYGTNGFYLPFTDNTSATTLAYDKSGNGNNWTPNNISTTAGATYDSMTDVPTLTSATAANFATLNPLVYQAASALTYSNANLTAAHGSGTTSAGGQCAVASTMSMTSGKWYFEFTLDSFYSNGGATPDITFGVQTVLSATNGPGLTTGWGIYGDGTKYPGGTAYGNSFTTNDIIGVAVDLTNSKIWFSKNGTWQASGDPAAGTNAAFTNVTGEVWAAFGNSTNSTAYNYKATANFGQRPFSYTPPTGFKALNTFNLPDPVIKKPNQYMDATTYTGTDGVGGTVVNAGGFQPDLVWIKARAVVRDHRLTDSVRGTGYNLASNLTAAEVASSIYLTSFNSNGFSYGVASDVSQGSMVGWQWQAGKGTTSSNTSGSITSTVSVNTTAGFSVVTYTGTGANATVGHGLGVAPAMMICKIRNSVSTENWYVWHQSISGSTPYIYLNLTNAAVTGDSTRWTAAPTSTLINLGSNSACNGNTGTYVTYCWAQIAGFSKFGSYTGNGSADGPFVYCGFRPRWILMKYSNTTSYWIVMDTERNTYNVVNQGLRPNTSDADSTALFAIDVLSNGFKPRDAGGLNGSGNTTIYAAFAENPFKFANAR